MLNNKINKKIIFKFISFLILLIGYYLFNSLFNLSIPCVFYKITGFYCPGCGITRMIFSLLKLDFYQAFRYNQLVFILLNLYVILICISFITKKKININNKVIYFTLVVTILFGILRNIKLFDFLAPI